MNFQAKALSALAYRISPILAISALMYGWSIINGEELARTGSEYVKDIMTDPMWLRALPKPDITRTDIY